MPPKMKNKLSLIFIFVSFISLQLSAQRNVVLIIADDLGSEYCGFYQNHPDTVRIPNIRSLLAKGVLFKNAWSNPLCSPTRAGILTGRYSFRTGVGNAVGGANSAVLDTSDYTIPRLLNSFAPGQIAKANIGKWHLHLSNPNSNFQIPVLMGYDYFEGNFSGALTSYTSWTKIKNASASSCSTYATTEVANNAISWMQNQDKPFFLWLAFNAPHTPHHLPPLDLHSYKNLSGTSADITTNPKNYFKASMESLDTEIGRIFDSIKVLGKWDSTDFIFIGDNGSDGTVSLSSGGGAKGSVYQEGIHVPFIISGPSVVNPCRTSDALVNTQDLFATILELFGDKNWRNRIPSVISIDSKSLVPIINNTNTEIRDWTFSEVFKVPTVAADGKAIRNKEFKLIQFDDGRQKFYKVSIDSMENIDLLLGTLNAESQENYNYLCGQMSTLLGRTDICKSSTGIGEVAKEFNIKIGPNPFINGFKIEGLNGTHRTFLFTSEGKLIYSGTAISEQDFSKLPQGIYILKIERLNRVWKLMKE
jgi:arylsulfatase B